MSANRIVTEFITAVNQTSSNEQQREPELELVFVDLLIFLC